MQNAAGYGNRIADLTMERKRRLSTFRGAGGTELQQDGESAPPRARHKFLTLGGLRGIAALSVVACHHADFSGSNPVPSAYIAVDIFFMMSGFVIAFSCDEHLSRGMTTAQFTLVRTVRLAPLYWRGTLMAAMAIGAAIISGMEFKLWTPANLAVGTLASMLLLPGLPLGADKMFLINIPAWALFTRCW